MSASNSKQSQRLRMLTTTAMLGAMAGVLMFIEFPLTFIAPSFYKLDFSEVPVLIGTFAFGPIQGIVIELIKILIHLIIKGTQTAFVGELGNLLIGCAFIIPAGIIYKLKKTKKNAIIGMTVSTMFMSVVGVFLNAFLLIPTYAAAFHVSVDTIVGMGHTVFPAVNDLLTLCLLCVLPFNLIKGILISVIVAIIYKPLSGLIHSVPEKEGKSYTGQYVLSFFVPFAGLILGGSMLSKKPENKTPAKISIVLGILSIMIYTVAVLLICGVIK